MTLAGFFFYVFAFVTIASAVMVISVRNPVHAVLFLILAFFNAAGLFVLLGAEFIAMILVIVYVGAVAVLFLFVVMMLDVDFAELRAGFQKYLPVGGLIGALLLAELLLVASAWTIAPQGALQIAERIPRGRERDQCGSDRPRPLHEICVLLPAFRPRPPDRDDRRHRPHAAAP